MPVEILIDENDTIDAIISVPTATVEIVANVTRQGDTIKLDGVHVELLADGPLDRLNIGMLCTEICQYFQVSSLIVQGARRTTGRSAGKIPRAIKHQVPK